MKIIGDYHLHTTVSDGRTTLGAHAKQAAALGIRTIAVTDHSFASGFGAGMTKDKFDKQAEEVRFEASKSGLQILHGIEANIVSRTGDIDAPEDILKRCEVVNLGYHRFLKQPYRGSDASFVFQGLKSKSSRETEEYKRTNTEAFIFAVRRHAVDTIVHRGHSMDLAFGAVAAAAKDAGVMVELNEKHIEALEPGIDEILKTGAEFILGSDAHTYTKTGRFERVFEFIKRHGIPESRVYGLNGKQACFKRR